jgi:hypothetical protein
MDGGSILWGLVCLGIAVVVSVSRWRSARKQKPSRKNSGYWK